MAEHTTLRISNCLASIVLFFLCLKKPYLLTDCHRPCDRTGGCLMRTLWTISHKPNHSRPVLLPSKHLAPFGALLLRREWLTAHGCTVRSSASRPHEAPPRGGEARAQANALGWQGSRAWAAAGWRGWSVERVFDFFTGAHVRVYLVSTG